ncbi:Thiamin diphosphate-binding protein [Tilletiaria anomala UBC 951]|uniref:Thiamin diphosphate-binding protein n=1 Tax=Tilletiaria anomala (strain ATCC 24038 / CBS 436.72 / UBC 951) TaxID=1037660 RepID=A0A066VVU0_TILAU|nr:thiamine diphosphate-binding protein [Tilletiaria anomala UBC 951]KDN45616.1 Thiamin diphosphate-binding protein [Tilletiaria anomala UBC 951]
MGFQLKDYDFKKFPVPLDKYKPVPLSLQDKSLSAEQKESLQNNINLLRDAIVFFTASGAARGVSGHTGGPYDTVPEVAILLSLFAGADGDKFVQVLYDESGHRVATQYLLSVLEGSLPAHDLLYYRAANSKLPGHPELGLTAGVKFSSGRLGHVWPMVNGVAFGNKDKITLMLGSDGSQQEGDDAEAARLAVAQNLNVKLFIDDNDVTIAGHPSEYFKGFDVGRTLEGHGLKVIHADGENLDSLYPAMISALNETGPVAVIIKRKMCPGIEGLEGSNHGHDVIPVDKAIKYLTSKGHNDAVAVLQSIKPTKDTYEFIGCTKDRGANRVVFGEAVAAVLDKSSKEENAKKVLCIDSDLEGSTGLKVIHQKHPEVFVGSGICERGNFAAAAGFGSFLKKGEYRTGIFSTFSAFLEMCVSEITMARLNFANVLCHFSHSGVDEMADNTCHFGVNTFFADNGLEDSFTTRLYFPADPTQMTACINKVLYDEGLRFVFSTRSKVPWVLKEGTQEPFYGEGYTFTPGKDDIIRKGTKGYVVSFGDMLYRSASAIDTLRKQGLDVGLVNKSTLNIVDEDVLKEIGQTGFVIVVESLNEKTGLGSKFGTWLLQRGFTPKFATMGVSKEGCGGLFEQIPYQGLSPDHIAAKIKELAA